MRSLLVLLIVVLSACGYPEGEDTDVQFSEAGVVIRGYKIDDGDITNKNPFPVRIQHNTGHEAGGETTNWLRTFQPGEKKPVYVGDRSVFYIYDMNGVKIGAIAP